jgi:large repetitive protein
MSERFDAAVWSGVERRLSAVEPFIPDAPPWQPAVRARDAAVHVGLGPTLRRPFAGARPRRTRLALAVAVIAILLAVIAGALISGSPEPAPSLRDERFGPFGSLRQTDGTSWATLLHDGRTLVVSGEWQGIGTAVARADIWDPVEGFVPASAPIAPRVNPTTTLLLDGRVLVVGGYGGPYQYASSAVATAEIWDPATATFRPTGPMAVPRVGHTATVLPDGRVLIVGGAGPDGARPEAELWDPRTDRFAPAGTLARARSGHAAALLADGRVAVAGGVDPVAGTGVGQVEVWDPATLRFTNAMGLPDSPTSVSLTRLPDGRVLVAGAFIVPYGTNYSGVVIWDPANPMAPGPSLQMTRHRDGHAASLLPDGRLILTGGRSPEGEVMDSVELWDPADGRFTETTPLPDRAANHSAVLLADGRILIVLDGSGPDGVLEPLIYEPVAAR